MKSKIVLFIAVLFAASFFASVAHATVLRVVTIQTDNPDSYIKEIEKGRTILKRLASPAILRVWRARFAGDNAGSIVVSIEYADMVTLASEDKKASDDPEYAAWLKGLGKVRKVISDSIYEELK